MKKAVQIFAILSCALLKVIDVSAQCTITPLYPTTLTATGGVVVSGTTNVTIQCVCPAAGYQIVRWYNTSKDYLTQSHHKRYVAGSPYFIPSDPNNRDVTLVIPTFTNSYIGTYHCGIFVNDTSFGQPSINVTLTIDLKVTIVSSPAGTPVSGTTNKFSYPILSSVTLMCNVTADDGLPVTVTSYQWNTGGCYTHPNHNNGNPACFPDDQTTQNVTDNDVTAEDAGTITCTVTINGSDYTSGPFTLRISGIALIKVGRNNNAVSANAITDYSYVNERGNNNGQLTRCATGLGPNDTDDNAAVGGVYFNGSRISDVGCRYSSSPIVRMQSGSFNNVVGVINTVQCTEFSTAAEGIYTCIMMNSSMMNESIRFGVYFTGRTAPVIDTPSSSTVTIPFGSSLNLNCTSRGSPPDTFTWRKDGGSILQSITNQVTYTSTNAVFRANYSIDNVTTSDSGTYTCTITNPIGSDSVMIIVVVIEIPPVIIQHPMDEPVSLSNNYTKVSLTCEADGASSYNWERQNGIIPSDSTGVNTNTLTLINLQPEDAGNYRCVATNATGSIKSDYALVTINVSPPRVVTHPIDTSAAAPFGALFNCSGQAYGYLTITWYRINALPKNASTLIPSVNVTTSILFIPNVTSEDVGIYYCAASAGKKAVRSQPANLFLADPFPPPIIIVVPGPVVNLTVNNHNLTIKCLHDKNNFNYKWIKKNDVLPLRAQGVNTPQLTIFNLTPEDSGDYQCVMSNRTGMISSNFSKVNIKASPPIITKHPTEKVVGVYSTITFECNVQGYGYINVTWTKHGSALPKALIVKNNNLINGVSSTLIITNTAVYYGGMYCCVANNKGGQATSEHAKLSVLVPCPVFIKLYQNVTVLVNQAADLHCLALSYGTLTYEWMKKANDLSTAATKSYVNKTFLYFDQTVLTYQLTIPNVQSSDEGWYCCMATNECGTTKRCIWLEVNTLAIVTVRAVSPAFKVGDLHVTVLLCSAIGMGPIYYQWEKYHLSNNSWISPSHRVVSNTSPNLKFRVIMEEDEGVYHCVVTNNDGSVISNNVTVHVYGPPIIIFISNDTVSLEGSKVNLFCAAINDIDAIHPLQINWYKGNKLVTPHEKHIIIHNENTNNRLLNSTLLINSVNRIDDGEYTCQSFNRHDSCSESNKTTLVVQYAPVVSIANESPYTINVGTLAILYCRARGKPIPTVQWYKDNSAVNPLPSLFQQQYIVETDSPHTTVYTCKANNYAGNMKHSSSANIIVIAKAVIPCTTLLDAPKNGKKMIIKTDGYVSHISFSCNPNYALVGGSLATCNNGTWSSSTPTCEKL